MERFLLDWLARVGPPVLFLAQIFGIFGVPFPDELLLVLAGTLMRQGILNVPATISATITGCAGGITVSFVLGRTIGAATLRLRALRVQQAALVRAQRWFERFGAWLLAFGYFVPGTRHVSAIAAGSASLQFRKFAAAAYPGAVLWSSVYLGIGYFASDRWRTIVAVMPGKRAALVLAVAAAFAIVIVAARRRRGRAGP